MGQTNDLDWYTIETPHFNVHFHSGLEEVAARTATTVQAKRSAMPASG